LINEGSLRYRVVILCKLNRPTTVMQQNHLSYWYTNFRVLAVIGRAPKLPNAVTKQSGITQKSSQAGRAPWFQFYKTSRTQPSWNLAHKAPLLYSLSHTLTVSSAIIFTRSNSNAILALHFTRPNPSFPNHFRK